MFSEEAYTMEAGILLTSHPDPKDEPYPHQAIHARVTQEVLEAEKPGFDSVWIAWCKDRIAYFKTPRYVEFVSSFPRTMTKNEIARHELRELGIGTAWDATIGEWTREHSNS